MGIGEGSKSTDISKVKDVPPDEEKLDVDENDRGQWGNQCEFFLSCLGYAVGFGNIWRFPYLCYKNGGAVFLIPYVICLLCAGLPLFFLELSLGQYISLGPAILFPKLAPIFTGLGWGMLMVSLLVAIYYNMILAWTIFYTFASFTSVLPWGQCDGDFNSPGCYTKDLLNMCQDNGTLLFNTNCIDQGDYCDEYWSGLYNLTHCYTSDGDTKPIEDLIGRISASEDYFKNRMLGVTGTTWENMGGLRWELVGCLALAWIIVGACLIKGVKSSGKVVYFTALFPYVVLVILFIRGVTLEGAYQGIEFYFLKPNVTKLYEVDVWNDAATQIFYSLGSSFGGLITLASYNKFKNNCMRDAIVIAFSNCATSVFSGFVIFSILGFMAHTLEKEVADVVSSGSGLAFVAYPEAVTHMPVPTLWALLFFSMLITLGLDSQFTMVETLTTAIFDQFESLRSRKPLVVSLMSFFLFLCGLTMCLDGGMYMFELFNWRSASISVMILAVLEIVSVQYVYGFRNYINNLTKGIGIYMPGFLYGYWAVTWVFITPALLVIILGLSFYNAANVEFDDYVFPTSVQALGWLVCASSVIVVPIFGGYAAYKASANNKGWRYLFERSPDFCPAHERKLMQTRGAALKGKPDGVFKYTYDNEGYQEGVAKVYPALGQVNSGYSNYM